MRFNHIWIGCILVLELTLSNEDWIFQVGRRRVVIVHLVPNKNDEPEKENKIHLIEVKPKDTQGLFFILLKRVKSK